jgi:hypothetical protein
VLLVLAVPRTVAAWAAFSSQAALAKVGDGRQPTAGELQDGIDGLTRAVAWIASERYLSELGTLELLLAQERAAIDPERGALLERSDRDLLAGLAKSPGDGTAWYRLAQVRQARGADGRAVVDALLKSLDLAPTMRSVWFGRTFGLVHYRALLSADEWAAVASNIRTIWGADEPTRGRLIGMLRGNSDDLAVLRLALSDDPVAREQFDRLK